MLGSLRPQAQQEASWPHKRSRKRTVHGTHAVQFKHVTSHGPQSLALAFPESELFKPNTLDTLSRLLPPVSMGKSDRGQKIPAL